MNKYYITLFDIYTYIQKRRYAYKKTFQQDRETQRQNKVFQVR